MTARAGVPHGAERLAVRSWSPVQIQPSRPLVAGQKSFRILVRDPFLIFGSQTGSHPGWCLLVTLSVALGGSGPLLAENRRA
jgi:hypothetical protein